MFGTQVISGATQDLAKQGIANAFSEGWINNRDELIRTQNPPSWFVKLGDLISGYKPPSLPPKSSTNFTGGQCFGVPYNVAVDFYSVSNRQSVHGPYTATSQIFTATGNTYGPVRNVELRRITSTAYEIWLLGHDRQGNATEGLIAGFGDGAAVNGYRGFMGPIRINRTDNKSDNCENITNFNTINNYYYNTVNNNTTINLPPLPTVEPPELPPFELPKFEPYQTVRPLTDLDDPIELPEPEEPQAPDWYDNPPWWYTADPIDILPPGSGSITVCPPALELSPQLDFKIGELNLNLSGQLNLIAGLLAEVVAGVANVQAELNLIAQINAKLDLILNANLEFKAEFTAIAGILAGILAKLDVNFNPTIEFSPTIDFNPEINISPEFNAEINAKLEQVLKLITEIEINPQIEFSPTIDFNPTLEINPSLDLELAAKLDLLLLLIQTIDIKVPLIETEKIIEVQVEVQPSTETVTLEVVECEEGEEPRQVLQPIQTLVGAVPVEVRQKFADTAAKALEACQEDEEENSCEIVLPSDVYSELHLETQLSIRFGTQYPKTTGSTWVIHIPNPRDDLDWCSDFESLTWNRGQVVGRAFFEQSHLWTGGYFSDESEARRVLADLAKLSKNAVTRPYRISKFGSPKRTVVGQFTRAVRAVVTIFDENSQVVEKRCYSPPPPERPC